MRHADAMPETTPLPESSRNRLVAITLDELSINRASASMRQEREMAIYDILDTNHFNLDGRDDGPYKLKLSMADERLVMTVGTETVDVLATFVLSLSPLRRIMKDYFTVCDSYYTAIRTSPPSRIQAIDMGRRSLHDDGSRLLAERLKGKISVDHDTARRLFTLICALHWRG
jgi:uncharacterized protein (UPF0262 family)